MATPPTKHVRYRLESRVYTVLWPAARLLRRRLYPPPRPLEIALTFDDGPNPGATARLLELLHAHNITAAFFLVGKLAETHPGLVRRIAAEGHVIGNHTYSHPNLTRISISEARRELQRANAVLEQITGTAVRVFRPPYGACNAQIMDVARALGMLPVFWNAIAPDWENRPEGAVVSELARQIERNGSRGRATYLVLHDGRAEDPEATCESSIAAAATLIQQFQEKYRFVSIQTW